VPDNLVPLGPLQSLAKSLKEIACGRVPDAAYRRRAVRSVRAGGDACVPLLARALRSDQERLSSWAYFLLSRLGGLRVVRELQELLRDRAIDDDAKALALALLAELHVPPPAEITLRNPDVIIARSVRDLVSGLRTQADVKSAADLVVAQIADHEIGLFCGELIKHGGAGALGLVRAIAARALSVDTGSALMALLRAQGEPSAKTLSGPAPRRAARALDVGLRQLEDGDARAALPHLRRFVRQNPDDAEGRSSLGVCLLEQGRARAALPHLEMACRVEPEQALHHWNLAAAAQKAGRRGRCYLALKAYLSAPSDDGPGAPERRAEAKAYVEEYERAVRIDRPHADPERLARGEEIFARAFAALAKGRARQAADGFERVLRLLPDHYPAWGNLGAALIELGEREQAIECLTRALEIRPDYELARACLRTLGDRW